MLRLLSLLLILLGVALPLQPLQAQEPAVQWEMATWSPTRPGGSAQTQATSGEDWAYDVAVSYTNGVADGYIVSGYSTFQGVYYPTPAPGCFLCPDNSFAGCSKAKLFKTDLNGKLLWYHDYGQSAAELYAVIQTLDGGYLAVGRTYQRGLTYYSPNHLEGISLNSCSANHTRRNAYVVKVGSDGTVVWEKSYGLLDDPLNVTQALLPQHDAQASDVVEMADGRVRISGYAPIEKPGGGYVTRAFMMELESDGTANWIKAYGDAATASLGRGIDRRGGDYVMVYNQFDDDDYTATGDLSYADIKVIKVDNATGSSGPNTLFDVLVTQSATVHDFGYDVVYNNAGEILVAGVIACEDDLCFRSQGARGEGTAQVFRLNATNGSLVGNPVNLGIVKAFDLWTTLEATNDGGSLFLSTKQDAAGPMPPSVEYSNTDAFVAKLSSAMTVEWDFTYDAATTLIHKRVEQGQLIEEFTNQECLYSIVETPDGGYLISGNNSSNWDDDYLVKFDDLSSWTLGSGTVDHSHIFYHAPQVLTLSGTQTVAGEGYLELIGGTEVKLTGTLTAQAGSEVELAVDASFGEFTSRIAETAPAPSLEKHTSGSLNRTASYWQRVGSAVPGTVEVLLAASDHSVFASSDSGFWRSTNFGESWAKLAAEVTGNLVNYHYDDTTWTVEEISDISAMVESRQGNLFVAGWQGILRSQDSGQTWREVNPRPFLSSCTPEVIRYHEIKETNDGSIVSALGYEESPGSQCKLAGSIIWSANQGDQWYGSPSGDPRFLAVDQYDHLLVGFNDDAEGRFFVYDQFAFSDLYPGFPANLSEFVAKGEYFFAGTNYYKKEDRTPDFHGRGIFRTTYAQATWQPVNTGLSDTTITALIVTPDDQLLAGTREGGVFLSGNNGLSWQPLNDGLANLHVRALAVGPEGTAYVATEEGLYRSTQPVPTAVEAPATGQVSPVSFQLVGNYPNPFNPTTRLVFEVASAQPVRLAVYDVLGREVAVLVEASVYPVGRHEVVFDGGDLPSGVYFSRLEAGSFTQVRPMMLVK
jgi:hypothetical protein